MSGHSKWHTIKHKKGALDAKRGKLFTRIAKEIEIAARNGGDPDANARLRTAITAGRAVSMPNENIQRAIKRGTGDNGGVVLEEMLYEGYGPGGSAMLIAAVTDNRNRTVSEIRSMLSKNNGNMAEPGAVGWMFKRKSVVVIEKEQASEEKLMDLLIEAGGDDLRDDGEIWTLLSEPAAHDAVLAAVQAAGIETASAEIGYVADNPVKLDGQNARTFQRLYGLIDDQDDVQNIWDNTEIDAADIEG